MPELPEVEVIRRELEPLLAGKRFASPRLYMPTTVAHPGPEQFVSALKGRRVTATGRRGKYLLFYLDRGILVVHLRMTGNLLFRDPEGLHPGEEPLPRAGAKTSPDETRFLRLDLPFSDGSVLHFCDMRRFGRLWLVENESELEALVLKRIGPDYLNDICRDDFVGMLKKKKKSGLKALLLDQGFASGMGNIYTDECLHRCGLNPRRRVESLGNKDAENLFDSINAVLQEGIEHGGTTFRDYRRARGALGAFQARLAVYGRGGEKCRCGATIEKSVVAGRGTYYCPRCQQ